MINNGLTMTRSIKVATFLLALLSVERALAASISTPIPYVNRMYGHFADFRPPDLEDLLGVTYNCTDYHYMDEKPGVGVSHNIRFFPGSHPRSIAAEYYGGDVDEDFTLKLTVHRTSGELGYFISKETQNLVHTYRVNEDARFLLVESVGKFKTWKDYREFMKPIKMPTVA